MKALISLSQCCYFGDDGLWSNTSSVHMKDAVFTCKQNSLIELERHGQSERINRAVGRGNDAHFVPM